MMPFHFVLYRQVTIYFSYLVFFDVKTWFVLPGMSFLRLPQCFSGIPSIFFQENALPQNVI